MAGWERGKSCTGVVGAVGGSSSMSLKMSSLRMEEFKVWHLLFSAMALGGGDDGTGGEADQMLRALLRKRCWEETLCWGLQTPIRPLRLPT